MPKILPSKKELGSSKQLLSEVWKYFNESPDPIPGFVGDDIAKGLAMVLNPKTIGKFQDVFTKNIASFKRRENHGIPWKASGLDDAGQYALAFLKTRYPTVISRAMRNVDSIATGLGSSYDPKLNTISLADYDTPAGSVGGLLHEIRHLFQSKVPRYPRGEAVLGPQDVNETIRRMVDVETASTPLKRTLALDKYAELPYEQDPTKAHKLGQAAYNRYLDLMGK